MEKNGIKIWYENPVAFKKEYEPLANLIAETTRSFCRPGTTIHISWHKQGYTDPSFPYTMSYNSIFGVQNIYEAQAQGYDAAVTGCICDAGLREARSMVDIPVAGVAESAFILALTLGAKYGVVVRHRGLQVAVENLIKLYGFQDRLAGVNYIDVSPTAAVALYKEPEKLIEVFSEKARQLMNSAGAEVIVAGDTIFSTLFTAKKVASIDGAPIVDPVFAGIKMAEILVDLKRTTGVSVSRASIYSCYSNWDKEIPFTSACGL